MYFVSTFVVFDPTSHINYSRVDLPHQQLVRNIVAVSKSHSLLLLFFLLLIFSTVGPHFQFQTLPILQCRHHPSNGQNTIHFHRRLWGSTTQRYDHRPLRLETAELNATSLIYGLQHQCSILRQFLLRLVYNFCISNLLLHCYECLVLLYHTTFVPIPVFHTQHTPEPELQKFVTTMAIQIK